MNIKLNESNDSGMLYAIASCEDPDIYSEEFWCWDTESDVGYELMEFGSLINGADVFDSLEAAEDRADDVLSSIFEDEVFIVGLDPYTPHNLTGFVKKVTRDSINESKSIKESFHKDGWVLRYDNGDHYVYWTADDDYTSDITNPNIMIYDSEEMALSDVSNVRKTYADLTDWEDGIFEPVHTSKLSINESKSIKESNTNPEDKFLFYFPYMGGPKTLNRERTIKQLEFELDNIKNNSGSAIAGRGFGVYCLESVDPETGTVWSGRYSSKEFLNCLHESKSIKESATGDYIEVAYICDGFTNFRVFGGGFKTSDALVSVEDEKGKRLRLTMGDVCEFYTWHDAKGNVIHEPTYYSED